MLYVVLIESKKKPEDLKAALENVKASLEATRITLRGAGTG